MIEFGGFPFFLVVASLAFFAQSALVHIILAMTCVTRSRRLLFCIKRLLMATHAFCQFMLAQQLEFRLCIVIKLDFFPVLLRMAGFALLAILPLMLVGLEMTCHALMRCALVLARIDMAFAAFHIDVFADERKMGLLETVVEFGFFPVALVMTALAISAQAALVLVILAMTVIASQRRFTIFFLRLVAIFALYFILFLVCA